MTTRTSTSWQPASSTPGRATWPTRPRSSQPIKAAVQTENGGRTLALARNLPGYVIAANLVNLQAADPTFDTNTFKPWLRSLLTETLDGQTLTSTHERRPNNWGTHAGAARVAVALYLGDQAVLSSRRRRVPGLARRPHRLCRLRIRRPELAVRLGQARRHRPAAASRAASPSAARCPTTCAAVDLQLAARARPATRGRRLQGAMLQAELLYRAGIRHVELGEQALLRAADSLRGRGWAAEGDDEWQPLLLDARYGTSYTGSSAGPRRQELRLDRLAVRLLSR